MHETKPITRLYDTDRSRQEEKHALKNGQVPVGVYGLGKMGLPLAGVYAEVTGNVVGADIDPEVVKAINSGEVPVKREPGLDELVAKHVSTGELKARSDPTSVAEEVTVHVIIVPTLIDEDKQPDLSALESVTDDIASGLEKGDLVILESTVPPRTCEDVLLPQLASGSDLDPGEFGLAFCPERTASGRAIKDIRGAYPKVIGGVDMESTRAAELIYEEINDSGVITTSDTTTAEAVKIFEGLYRDVNIAFVNEMATFAGEFGIDINEAIDVANTAPYVDLHEPGPGVGGHCIPFYPYFVINEFEGDARMLRTARQVNEDMPEFTVSKVREELAAEGKKVEEVSILVLGLTYRPGVEEIRASPSIEIAQQLSDAKADVYGVDPVLDSFAEFALDPLSQNEIYDHSFDAVVVVTPHNEFDRIRWDDLEREDGQLIIVDGRDSYNLEHTTHRIYTLGNGKK